VDLFSFLEIIRADSSRKLFRSPTAMIFMGHQQSSTARTNFFHFFFNTQNETITDINRICCL